MNQKQIISEFKQFMKSCRAWSKWVRNKKSSINEQESKFLMRNARLPKVFMTAAFTWENAPEGDDFWSVLSIKWLNRLSELEKQSKQ